MTKYIIKPGMRGLFSVNHEENKFDVIDYMHTNIDWAYQVPEDGELIVEDEMMQVKKDDIVIVFYSRPYKIHKAIVIDSKEWKDNIAAEKAYEEEQRSKKTSDCCDGGSCCECCENCCKEAA